MQRPEYSRDGSMFVTERVYERTPTPWSVISCTVSRKPRLPPYPGLQKRARRAMELLAAGRNSY